MTVLIHTQEDFAKMRAAGKLAASVLDFIGDFVREGVATDELNRLCHEKIVSAGAIPAPLNYKGFPKSICTSVNHCICHGVPDDTKLKDGDIINVDVTVLKDGYHGDTSTMYFVGEVSEMIFYLNILRKVFNHFIFQNMLKIKSWQIPFDIWLPQIDKNGTDILMFEFN